MLATLRYIEPMSNETVAVGRDAKLQCVEKHLQDYKVSLLQIIICKRSTERLCITCLIKCFHSKIAWLTGICMTSCYFYSLIRFRIMAGEIQVSTYFFWEIESMYRCKFSHKNKNMVFQFGWLIHIVPWIPTKLSLGEGPPQLIIRLVKEKSIRFILHF
jgi:hypothetical protein